MKNIIRFTSKNKRENNEDSCLGFELLVEIGSQEKKLSVLILSDGMGGHEFGELASNLVVDSMAQLLSKRLFNLSIIPTLGNDSIGFYNVDFEKIIYECMAQTNQKVLTMIKNNKWKKAGATAVVAIVIDDIYYWGNLGDSYLFQWRQEKRQLEKVSYDHSMVGILLEEGAITPEVAGFHADKHRVVYHMGIENFPSMDKVKCVGKGQLKKDDILLLCSDGISGKSKPGELEEIFKKHLEKPGKEYEKLVISDVFNKLINELVEFNIEKDETDNQTLVMYIYKKAEAPGTSEILFEIEEKNRALETVGKERIKIENELEVKSDALRSAEEEKEKTKVELDDRLADIRKAEDEKKKMQVEIQQKSQTIEKTSTEIEKLKKELSKKTLDLENAKKIKVLVENRLEDSKKSAEATEEETNRLKKQLSQRETEAKSAEEEVEKIKQELKVKNSAVLSLEDELNKMSKKLQSKDDDVKSAKDEISRLNNELELKSTAVKSAEEAINKMRSELEWKSGVIKAAETEIDKLKYELELKIEAVIYEKIEKENLSNKLDEEKKSNRLVENEKNEFIYDLKKKNLDLVKKNRKWKFISLALAIVVIIVISGLPGKILRKGDIPQKQGISSGKKDAKKTPTPTGSTSGEKIGGGSNQPTEPGRETQITEKIEETVSQISDAPADEVSKERSGDTAPKKGVGPENQGAGEPIETGKNEKDYFEYEVNKGDTIAGIARKNNLSEKDITELNGIKNSDTIKVDQKIRIPLKKQE